MTTLEVTELCLPEETVRKCAIGSLVCPIVVKFYIEYVEEALNTYKDDVPSLWFRYVDDTWVKIKSHEIVPLTDYTAQKHSVHRNIKFTGEEMS